MPLNPEIIARIPVCYTNFRADFARIGQQVIFDIFDETRLDKPFTTGDLVGHLPCIAHYGSGQQRALVRGALRYLELEGESTGEPQVTRLSPNIWALVSYN